jgi:hypothetical protein
MTLKHESTKIKKHVLLCTALPFLLNLSGCYKLFIEPYLPKQSTPQQSTPKALTPTAAQEKPMAEEQFETNTDLVAIPAFGGRWMSAPLGMSLKDLGRPYTAGFQRIQGPGGASLFPKSGEPSPTKQNLMKSEALVIEDEQMLYAQASAWGFGGIESMTSSGSRYAVYRAMIISDVYEIDDTTLMRKAPKDAVYYPARIYFGHVYEVVVSGSESSFDTSIAAEFGIFGGSIDDFVYRNKLSVKASGRGLKPTTGKAIFARTEFDIEQSYSASQEDAVPILVEWQVIPGREEPNKKIAWKSLKKNCAGEVGCEPCNRWSFDSVEYSAPRRKSNGNDWDPDGSGPDLILQINAGAGSQTTAKQSETYYGAWTFSPEMELNTGDYLYIKAIDYDPFGDNDTIDQLTGTLPSRLDRGVWTLGTGNLKLYGYCQHQ